MDAVVQVASFFLGRPAVFQQPDSRQGTGGAAAGSIMRDTASLVRIVSLSTSVQAAKGRTACFNVLRKEKDPRLSRRGATPVRVDAMLPFLEKYPNRLAALSLRDGFRFDFKIPSSSVASGSGGIQCRLTRGGALFPPNWQQRSS